MGICDYCNITENCRNQIEEALFVVFIGSNTTDFDVSEKSCNKRPVFRLIQAEKQEDVAFLLVSRRNIQQNRAVEDVRPGRSRGGAPGGGCRAGKLKGERLAENIGPGRLWHRRLGGVPVEW